MEINFYGEICLVRKSKDITRLYNRVTTYTLIYHYTFNQCHMPTWKIRQTKYAHHRPVVVRADCNTSSRYFSAAAYCLFLSSIASAARALSWWKLQTYQRISNVLHHQKKRRRKQKAKGILEVNPGNFLMCRLWVLSSSRDPSYAQPFPSTHHDWPPACNPLG